MLILFPTRTPTAGATPGSTQELRQFLDQAVNNTTPLTYTDRAGYDHQVFMTQVDEVTVRTKSGRDEAALALTMIETVPETEDQDPDAAPVTARKQELFLLRCVDSTTPIEYEDRQNRMHRVFVTRMSLAKRVAKARPNEWQYTLTMVDAWGGVWVYALPKLTITIATTVTVRTHATAKYGTAELGFAQFGE